MARRDSRSRLGELRKAAARVRKNAHAPYSDFPVGAAVLAGGKVFTGCNVENSSFPLGMCAERGAISAMVAAGQRRLDAVAIVGGALRPVPPCGGCRQVLAEFGEVGTPVLYATPGGRQVETTLGALLPSAFGPGDLQLGRARGESPALRVARGGQR